MSETEHTDIDAPVWDPPTDAPSADADAPGLDAPGPDDDGFASLGLRPELLAALAELGYEEPTPIQRETIPYLVAGRDLLGQAATGTGKTAAFALPILQHVDTSGGRRTRPSALVLVPTRELAMQVSEAIFKYGRQLGVRVVPIYGGQPIQRQLQQLDRGVDVVVATPGRAVDHIGRGSLPLDDVRVVVLDEADEMLDMGFADDLEAILDATPAERQTVLFSATLPARINSIAKRYQRDPIRIKIARNDPKATTATVRQQAYVVQRAHKPAALGRVLDVESPGAAIVFCRTRGEVDELTVTMNGRGYRAEALHGGLDQQARDKVMARLRDGTAELLIATDVAARGLDVDVLTHVVNYDVPSSPESYVHRIGRVGRAGRDGVAITLAEPREQRQLANIERITGQTIGLERVPTVADLRARRLTRTTESVRTAIAAGGVRRRRVGARRVAGAPLTRGDRARRDQDGARRRGCRRRRDGDSRRPALRAPRTARQASGHGAWQAGREACSTNAAATTPSRPATCTSRSAAVPGCARPTWSARSRTKSASRAAASARSGSPISSAWSASPNRWWSGPCRHSTARRSAASPPRCVATPSDRPPGDRYRCAVRIGSTRADVARPPTTMIHHTRSNAARASSSDGGAPMNAIASATPNVPPNWRTACNDAPPMPMRLGGSACATALDSCGRQQATPMPVRIIDGK